MGSRFIVEECFKWAHQRKVFGKALIEQPVIRAKFASMFAKIEATQALLEHISESTSTLPIPGSSIRNLDIAKGSSRAHAGQNRALTKRLGYPLQLTR
jgi:alkylation response protein AidB-like acyl-CoA dehydrogenase